MKIRLLTLRLNVLRCSPSQSFPILVYFKETQTPEENWNVGPGEQANSPEAIANGAGKATTSHRLSLQHDLKNLLTFYFHFYLPNQYLAKSTSFPQLPIPKI